MLSHKHLHAIEQIDAIQDRLKADLPDEFKRRDPKEPGRIQKEAYEDRIDAIMQRYFNGQKQRIRAYLKQIYPARKAIILPEDIFKDERVEALFYMLFANMSQHAMELFMNEISVGFNVAEYNINALQVARRTVAELVTKINSTTREAIQEAVSLFHDTPGMTIGELSNMLPFGELRSRLIAITETSNLYAGVQTELGQRLMQEFPGVRVVKTWFTNNDDRVCPICGPLHGLTIEMNELFDGQYEKPAAHPRCRCWISVRTVIE